MISAKRVGIKVLASSGLIAAGIFITSLVTSPSAETAVIDAASPLKVLTLSAHLVDSYSVEEEYSGQLKARRSSQLGFEQGGLLTLIQIDEGDHVEKGQLLAQLDTRRLVSQQAVLKAKVTSSRAGVSEANADADMTQATAKRHKKLAQSGRVSKQLLEESLASANQAKARKRAAQARLQQSIAELNALKVSLELSELRAPYTGRIAKRALDEGAAVAAGQSILTLIESEQIEAHVGIPQWALPSITKQTTYPLLINGKEVTGHLRQILPEVNQQTRTVNVILELDRQTSEYRDGQLVKLKLTRRINQDGYWLPISALAEGRRGLWTAYAVAQSSEGELLETRALQVLHTEATRVFVRGTLNDGDQLVRAGLHRLVSGQQVISGGVAQ